MPGKVCKGLLRIGEAGESADPVPGQGGIGGGIVITAADQKDLAAGGQLPGPLMVYRAGSSLRKVKSPVPPKMVMQVSYFMAGPPFVMEYAFPVSALKGMCAEEVALRLNQIGSGRLRAEAV